VIRRLTPKNLYDVYEFILRTKDQYQDFYITINNERIFLNNIKVIKKLLKNQKLYALYNKEITGILLIYYQKGFRPYFKLLTNDRNDSWALCRFFMWNFFDEIYAKLKNNNPLTQYLLRVNKRTGISIMGFVSKSSRGDEILLYRPKQQKFIFKGEKEDDS